MLYAIMGKTQTRQFEILIEFMERHGDLQIVGPQDRLENLKKWHELVDLLNNSTQGEPKSFEKWRKVWSDLKNNTKRKVERLRRNGSERTQITPLEKRVLNLIGYKRKNREMSAFNEQSNIQFKLEADSDPCRSSSSPPDRYFTSVGDIETNHRSKSSSSSSSISSHSSEQPVKKKTKSDVTSDSMKDITDRFFEYEREKDRMAHEQQMAQITQNEKILSILGRMVNVLETLAPSIQKYLESNANGNG